MKPFSRDAKAALRILDGQAVPSQSDDGPAMGLTLTIKYDGIKYKIHSEVRSECGPDEALPYGLGSHYVAPLIPEEAETIFKRIMEVWLLTKVMHD